jgi:hypothetical protein
MSGHYASVGAALGLHMTRVGADHYTEEEHHANECQAFGGQGLPNATRMHLEWWSHRRSCLLHKNRWPRMTQIKSQR